ncbi:MAG: hypothetical protein DYG88_09260 [Chloroflexi bacterium CFX4]|nr:hypothetical protein [Chloroflexi bacterium CFX4]MDL1922197.1 hypothetical protein [Chloroflexi bacterium CFX3]
MQHGLFRLRGLFFVIGLAAILTLSTFTSVGMLRGRQDYGCLTFNSYIFDIENGIALPHTYSPPSQPPPDDLSPNGRYQLVRHYDEQGALRLELLTRDGSAPLRLLQAGMHGWVRTFWAPNSRWLAALWQTSVGEMYLSVADILSEHGQFITYPANTYENVGWSPNSQYLWVKTGAPNLLIWSAESVMLGESSLPSAPYGTDPVFSHAGDKFAYLISYDNQTFEAVIATPQGVLHHISIGILGWQRQPLSWSPHDRHIAYAYEQFPREQIMVVDADGGVHSVALVAQRGDSLSQPLFHWSADGESIFYLQDEGESPLLWHWVGYRILARQHMPIVPNLATRPHFSPRNVGQMVAVWWDEQGKRSAALMNLDGSERVAFFENADDAGNPYWSPDGKFAALVWGTGTGAARRTRLTWVNAETGAGQTLSEGLWDARDLRWLGSSEGLFFVAERGGTDGKPTYSAEYLSPGTGAHHVLAADKEAIGTVLWQGSDLQFWWRTGKTLGVERYAPNGEVIFRYAIEDDGSTSILSNINIQESGSAVVMGIYPQVFPAPNANYAALKVGNWGDEKLYLVRQDGTWQVVRDGLSGLGDPLWSADGARLAFTQSVKRAAVTLEIVNANGTLIRRVEGYRGIFFRLQWTRCGYAE